MVTPLRVPTGSTASERWRDSANSEAELLQRVQHVNVVQLLDVRHEALGDVLVLEWCCCDLEQARWRRPQAGRR